MNFLTYDIKNEQEYLRSYENPIQKFYKYKITKDDFDCDVSYFAMQKACEIYPYLTNAKIVAQSGNNKNGLKFELHLQNSTLTYRGDTCNSYQTLYRRAVTKLIPNKVYDDICNHYGNRNSDTLQNLLSEHDGISKDFENELPLNVGPLLSEFATVNHTLPNMILLPIGLNVARQPLTSDNFSLFLYSAYNYLYKKDGYLLQEIFSSKVKSAKEYLDYFGDWLNFIENNLLESYLDDDCIPKEFVKGQFARFEEMLVQLSYKSINKETIEKYTCAQTANEFAEYLQNVISILKKRSEAMLKQHNLLTE